MTEPVEIWTTNPPLHRVAYGVLFVGVDGLPEVRVTEDAVEGEVHQVFRPATIPACWVVMPPEGEWRGVLLEAWHEIEGIRERLRAAEREANRADD